jgi:hypothetical protein
VMIGSALRLRAAIGGCWAANHISIQGNTYSNTNDERVLHICLVLQERVYVEPTLAYVQTSSMINTLLRCLSDPSTAISQQVLYTFGSENGPITTCLPPSSPTRMLFGF